MRKNYFLILVALFALTACHSERQAKPDVPKFDGPRVSVMEAITSVNNFLAAIDPQTRGGRVRQISDIYAVNDAGSTRATHTRVAEVWR